MNIHIPEGKITAIVGSLNEDILTPLLGIFGGTDFSDLSVRLGAGENAPVLTYGNFITAIINFLITAFVIFMIVKAVNKTASLKKKEEELNSSIGYFIQCPGWKRFLTLPYIKWSKVFAIAPRKPIFAITEGGIEFRCSYVLTIF